MIITSHHRSRALALRHLTSLRREYDHAELLSQRNAFGRYSKRGHTFIFEVRREEKKKRTEYVVHFDYGSRKAKNLIRFQVHIFGPADASDTQAIRAIRTIERGEKLEGWKAKAIFWGHPPKATNKKVDSRVQTPRAAAIDRGSARVTRREISTSEGRSARKKTKKG